MGGFAKSKTGRFWGDLRRNFPKQGVAQDEDLGRTQPDFVEQPRFQSHHRDLAASEEIGLGRALVLHELMNATPHAHNIYNDARRSYINTPHANCTEPTANSTKPPRFGGLEGDLTRHTHTTDTQLHEEVTSTLN